MGGNAYERRVSNMAEAVEMQNKQMHSNGKRVAQVIVAVGWSDTYRGRPNLTSNPLDEANRYG